MQADKQPANNLPQQSLLRVRAAEERVARQLEAIRELERVGQAAVATDARNLLNAWRDRLHTARRDLERARASRRTGGVDRIC